MLLTVESKGTDVVEIHLDSEGLESLLAQLGFLVNGKTDHVHLMTEGWGDGGLTEALHGDGTKLVHHLKILKRD